MTSPSTTSDAGSRESGVATHLDSSTILSHDPSKADNIDVTGNVTNASNTSNLTIANAPHNEPGSSTTYDNDDHNANVDHNADVHHNIDVHNNTNDNDANDNDTDDNDTDDNDTDDNDTDDDDVDDDNTDGSDEAPDCNDLKDLDYTYDPNDLDSSDADREENEDKAEDSEDKGSDSEADSIADHDDSSIPHKYQYVLDAQKRWPQIPWYPDTEDEDSSDGDDGQESEVESYGDENSNIEADDPESDAEVEDSSGGDSGSESDIESDEDEDSSSEDENSNDEQRDLWHTMNNAAADEDTVNHNVVRTPDADGRNFPQFNRLSAELRIKVWNEAVHGQNRRITMWFDRHNGTITTASTPSLLLACRESNIETRRFYCRIQNGILYPNLTYSNVTSGNGPLVSFENDIFYIQGLEDVVEDLQLEVMSFCKRIHNIPDGWGVKPLKGLVISHQAKRFGLNTSDMMGYFHRAAGPRGGMNMVAFLLNADELWEYDHDDDSPLVTYREQITPFRPHWRRYERRWNWCCDMQNIAEELRSAGKDEEVWEVEDIADLRCGESKDKD